MLPFLSQAQDRKMILKKVEIKDGKKTETEKEINLSTENFDNKNNKTKAKRVKKISIESNDGKTVNKGSIIEIDEKGNKKVTDISGKKIDEIDETMDVEHRPLTKKDKNIDLKKIKTIK
jgi:uncharacterized protein YvpB